MLELLFTQPSKRKTVLFFGLSLLLTAVLSLWLQNKFIQDINFINPITETFWIDLIEFFLTGRFVVSIIVFFAVNFILFSVLPRVVWRLAQSLVTKVAVNLGHSLADHTLENRLKASFFSMSMDVRMISVFIDNDLIKLEKKNEGYTIYQFVRTDKFSRLRTQIKKKLYPRRQSRLSELLYPIPIVISSLIILDGIACSESEIPLFFLVLSNVAGVALIVLQYAVICFSILTTSWINELIKNPKIYDEIIEKKQKNDDLSDKNQGC